MTGVSYTFTDANGAKRTTSSYTEMQKYIAKNSPFAAVYTPIIKENREVPDYVTRIKF